MSSLRAVAAEANVSQSTVSKVLNNARYSQIPSSTQVRIREAALRVGYHPSAIARGLAGKRMNTLGVILAYKQESVTSDAYMGPCLDGILDITKQCRQKTVLFTEDSWEEALRQLPSYCDGHCDGLMLLIPRADSQIIEALLTRPGRPMPFVLVGDSRLDSQVVTVDIDNVAAARAVVAHLVGLGHRRIAAFCGNKDFLSSAQRLDGYRLALADAGLPCDPALIYEGEYFVPSGYDNACLLMRHAAQMPPDFAPTAVFGFNDNIALGALAAFREKGVQVPAQMSVVGFDDTAQAAAAPGGGLTTMRQDVRAVGRSATHTLLRLIEGEVPAGHQEWVQACLIERGTTGPAPSNFGKEDKTN